MYIILNIDMYINDYYRCISTMANSKVLEQTADCRLQTARYLQSSSYLYQRRLGWFLQLANLRSAKTRELLHNPHNCISGITVYKSKIHVLKYIMNKIEYIVKYK